MIVCGEGTRYDPSLRFACNIARATGLIEAVVSVARLRQSSCLPPAKVRYRESGWPLAVLRLPGQNCAASLAAERSLPSAGRMRFATEVGSNPFTCRVPWYEPNTN